MKMKTLSVSLTALLLASCSSGDTSDGSGSNTNNTVDQGVKDAVAAQIGGGGTPTTAAATPTTTK